MNIVDKFGETMLEVASEHGHPEVVYALLKAGEDNGRKTYPEHFCMVLADSLCYTSCVVYRPCICEVEAMITALFIALLLFIGC